MYVLLLLISICIICIHANFISHKHSPLSNGTQTCNMLVVIIIYMSALISVKCYTTRKSNIEHNGHYKSLRQVSQLLAAVEKIIQNERQILREKANRRFRNGRADRRHYMDYAVSNINWWNIRPDIIQHQTNFNNPTTPHNNYNINPTENTFDVSPSIKQALGQWIQDKGVKPNYDLKNTFKPPEYGKIQKYSNEKENSGYQIAVDRWVQDLSSARPKIFGRPISSSTANTEDFTPYYEVQESTHSPFDINFEYGGADIGGGFIVSPTQMHGVHTRRPQAKNTGVTIPVPLSHFVHDLNDQMVQRNVGPFTVFLTQFLTILENMTVDGAEAFFIAIKKHVHGMHKEGKLQTLGEPTTTHLLSATESALGLPGQEIIKHAATLVFYLVNAETFFDQELGNMLSTTDGLFTKDESNQLFQTIEHLHIYSMEYPHVTRTAEFIVDEMITAMLAPLTRLSGTREHRQFIVGLNKLLSKRLKGLSLRRSNKHSRSVIVIRPKQKHTRRILQTRHYPQFNFRRRIKHERHKHHKTNKKHRNHRRRNLRRMMRIRPDTDETKKQQLIRHKQRQLIRALLDTTTNKNNVIEKIPKTRKVKPDNPISLTFNRLRINSPDRKPPKLAESTKHDRLQINSLVNRKPPELEESIKNNGLQINSLDRKPPKLAEPKKTSRSLNYSQESLLTRTKNDKELMRKNKDASISYSDNENDLKINLYRALDLMK